MLQFLDNLKQFWILDFQFWIDPDYKGAVLKDFEFVPPTAVHVACFSAEVPKNLKSKIRSQVAKNIANGTEKSQMISDRKLDETTEI
ncbi:hypothetical protein Cal7507_4202 [Calothrix sp. PCC 7507]|nr:hypothetical protein Cal7507_4202 [Calothrix sp. PCC 7507]